MSIRSREVALLLKPGVQLFQHSDEFSEIEIWRLKRASVQALAAAVLALGNSCDDQRSEKPTQKLRRNLPARTCNSKGELESKVQPGPRGKPVYEKNCVGIFRM